VITQHQAIIFLSGFQKGLLIFFGFRKIFSNGFYCYPSKMDAYPRRLGMSTGKISKL